MNFPRRTCAEDLRSGPEKSLSFHARLGAEMTRDSNFVENSDGFRPLTDTKIANNSLIKHLPPHKTKYNFIQFFIAHILY